MERARVLAALGVILLAALAVAAERPIVAVFDVERKGLAIAPDALDRLTDYLGSLLAERGYQVIPRSQLKKRLLEEKKASYKLCYDAACQIEIGKELAAQKSLASQIIKLGNNCKVTLTLYDLKRAASERGGTASGGCGEDEVVSSLEQAVGKLFGEVPSAKIATPEPSKEETDYEQLAARLEAEKASLEKAWLAVKKILESEAVEKKERARLLRKFVEDFPHNNPHQKEALELADFLETVTPPGMIWVFSTPAGIEFTKSEVTVAQYRECVKAGKCTEPESKNENKYCNWGYPDRENHPINCVDWNQATAFCEWVGGRLPTEQEWEKEASNNGSRNYPWGNQEVTCEYAVMSQNGDGCGRDSTWPVCSKPAGNSISGLCDMSGNVWEWTSSLYDNWYDWRVLRGGSWSYDLPLNLRASNRSGNNPTARVYNFGFRCGRASR